MPHDVLIITAGLNAAVVTETIWALAHPDRSGAAGRFVPTEVIVCTTEGGKKELERSLPVPIDELCKELGIVPLARERRVRIEALVDARTTMTGEQAARFGDAMIRIVQKHTATDATRVHVSTTGGLNPMRQLAQTALSLLGRMGDELSYTVVSRDYENHPDFYWPSDHYPPARDGLKAGELLLRDSRVVRARDADIQLVGVPYLRQRARLPRELLKRAGSVHAGLVAEANALAEIDSCRLTLDVRDRTVRFAEMEPLELDAELFALYWVMAAWAKMRHAGAGDPTARRPTGGRGWLLRRALQEPEDQALRRKHGWPVSPLELHSYIWSGAKAYEHGDMPPWEELATLGKIAKRTELNSSGDRRSRGHAKSREPTRRKLFQALQAWAMTPELAARLGAPHDFTRETLAIGISLNPDQIHLLPATIDRPMQLRGPGDPKTLRNLA